MVVVLIDPANEPCLQDNRNNCVGESWLEARDSKFNDLQDAKIDETSGVADAQWRCDCCVTDVFFFLYFL